MRERPRQLLEHARRARRRASRRGRCGARRRAAPAATIDAQRVRERAVVAGARAICGSASRRFCTSSPSSATRLVPTSGCERRRAPRARAPAARRRPRSCGSRRSTTARATANAAMPLSEQRDAGDDRAASTARSAPDRRGAARDGSVHDAAARRRAGVRASSTDARSPSAGLPCRVARHRRQLERAEELDLVLELDAELLARARGAPRPSARARRRSWRAPAFSMKFAWRGEICAPPIRWPRRPQASSIRPARELVLRVLEDAAERALVRRLRRLPLRLQLGDRRLDLVDRPRRRGAARRARRPGRGRSAECRYASPSSAGVSQPRAVGVDDERPLEHAGEVAAVGARVHPDAAAGRARDRAGELEAAEPGGAGAVQADRVRRAAARDEQLALDRDRGELAARA